MKINEITIIEDDDNSNPLASYDKRKDKFTWKSIQTDKTKQEIVFDVRGVEYKGYIDYDKNLFFVMLPNGEFEPADPTFTRQAFKQNTWAKFKNVYNLDPSFKDRYQAFMDPSDPTGYGAGQASAYVDKKGAHKFLGTIGARAGGMVDRYFSNRKAQKELGDIWQQTYGVSAPKAGDEIIFRTNDGKVYKAEMIKLTLGVDRDGDGVPDMQIKGNFDPSNPNKQTTTGITSSSVLSIRGQKLVKQKLPKKQQRAIDRTSNDPGDAGMAKPPTGDPAAV